MTFQEGNSQVSLGAKVNSLLHRGAAPSTQVRCMKSWKKWGPDDKEENINSTSWDLLSFSTHQALCYTSRKCQPPDGIVADILPPTLCRRGSQGHVISAQLCWDRAPSFAASSSKEGRWKMPCTAKWLKPRTNLKFLLWVTLGSCYWNKKSTQAESLACFVYYCLFSTEKAV